MLLHRPMSRALIAGAAFLSLTTVPGPAPADTFFETVYLPTSSVVSTSYVVPTSYATTYYPTSSVISSSEVLIPTTSYYRSYRYRPRRYVERAAYFATPTYSLARTSYVAPTSYVVPTSYLVPTSYVMPTSYLSTSFLAPTSYVLDTGIVMTSASSPCDTSSTEAPARTTASRPSNANVGNGNTITSEPMNGGSSTERKPSASLNSTPSTGDGTTSNVDPPVTAPKPAGAPPKPGSLTEPPVTEPTDVATPPAAPPGDPKDFPIPAPGKAGGAAPQAETTFRSVRRPAYDVRNILRGRVISAESRRPEEGVTVIVSSLTKNFGDRLAMTDADGEFKISLPDGDWTVKVKMPSGSILPVGRDYVTASSGRITDTAGRSVTEYGINR